MMRILLASGEEAVYRTVDELALGISSGTITAAARVFDAGSRDWRAIDSHPEYHEALARAAAIGIATAFESDVAPVAPVPAAPIRDRASGPFQVYQMFSRSAAELQARRRPAWLLPGLAGVAGLFMLVSVALHLRGDSAAPRHVENDSASLPAIDTRLAARTTTLPSPVSVEAIRLAPVNLNSHLAWAMDGAGRRLVDSAAQLGVGSLLSRGRLLSADSVRLTRDLLISVRGLVAAYRGAQRHTAMAYRDTAAGLVRSGFWSRIDEQEWRLYPQSMESPREAAQADSLLEGLDRLYELLEEEAGRYREVGGRLSFDEPASDARYERLRALIFRHESAGDTARIGANGPLALLRRAVGGPPARTFPARP